MALGLIAALSCAQLALFTEVPSVALLADLIRNLGDAAGALPLLAFFVSRSTKVELIWARLIIIVALAATSVCGFEAINRLHDPPEIKDSHAVALGGAVGVVGSLAAAIVRVRAGRASGNRALLVDGRYTYVDALTSIAVIGSAVAIAEGLPLLDPLIGLGICAVGLWIAWSSWWAVNDIELGVR